MLPVYEKIVGLTNDVCDRHLDSEYRDLARADLFSGKDDSDLWAITSYFNPVGYRRRLENYRLFRKSLSVPLIAVELAYGSEFELTTNDADVLVQLRGNDILWQKERLLNVALSALPLCCRKVAWIDCDIIFGINNWAKTVSALLERFMIVQPFSRVHHLRHDWIPGESIASASKHSHVSAAFAIASNVSANACVGEITPRSGLYLYSKGFVWAARRELLDEHGFYDASIMGGGDRPLVCAAYGCFEEAVRIHCMNDRQRRRYLAWAKPFYTAIAGATGVMNGDIYHLWHGEIEHRGYHGRHKTLASFDFDPSKDIVVNDNGCWRWNTDKRAMHEYVRQYFSSRREDG